VVVVEVTGAALRRAMENGLSLLPQPSGRFPQVSGIALQFDLSRRAGERVTAMQVGGVPVVDDRTYRVAILDFLARGGDDYTMFRDATRITPDNDAPMMVNEVVGYLRKLGTVRTGIEGRIVAK
jgi:2',3'-cyclic-nucleotide 2'-phosphodiesterase (5'-nucleotidase family)